MRTHRKRFTLRLLIPRTRPAQRSAYAPSRQFAPQARQVREERVGRPSARRPARARHGAAVARPGASELDAQSLVGPLEAEVRPPDLALGFAVLPEHQFLDVMRPQILAQALERPRRVLDDALAVLFEAVVGERVGVALEVRPDRLVSAVSKYARKVREFERVIAGWNFDAHGFKRIKKCRRRDSNPYAKYLARDFKSLVSAIPPLRREVGVL